MNSRIVTAIALKLFAIWVIVQIILQIPFVWQMYYLTKQIRSPEVVMDPLPYLILLSLVVCGLIAGVIIFKLGQKVLETLPSGESLIDHKDTEKLLLQLLGIIFIVTALSRLPSAGVAAYSVAGKDPVSDWLWFGALLFKFIFGILLVMKSGYIQAFLKECDKIIDRPITIRWRTTRKGRAHLNSNVINDKYK